MADEQAQQEALAQPAAADNQLDPAFFTAVNEYLELTNKQSRQHGLKRISLASLYAAARFNSHVFLSNVAPGQAAGDRAHFLDYMATMYRRMLNEHLDGLGVHVLLVREHPVQDLLLGQRFAAARLVVGTPSGGRATRS